MNLAYWLNTAWMAKCRREAHAFEQATHQPAAAQQAVLRNILDANRSSEFGQRHQFANIANPSEFQQRVPLSTYESYAAAIDRMAGGAEQVLTCDKVLLFEPTSGTSRGEKLIPYTASLRAQFQRMAAVWIYDLMRRRPALRQGRAYWSISPAMGAKRRTGGGVPIGFDDDTQYLSGLERRLARSLLAVPPDISKLSHLDNFRYATLLHLIRAPDLTLISIWSPTFLDAIFAGLEVWTDRLAYDLKHGGVSWPQPVDATPRPAKAFRFLATGRPLTSAAETLRSSAEISEKLRRLWPQLALISCWADATAALYLPRLREYFPHVEIQPKGLLATEGCVSTPLWDQVGAALALRSHFLEFQELDGSHDASAPCRFAWRLDRGGRYGVVLTTAGGLYRYQLGDEVEVVGFKNNCPCVRFRGRLGMASDLVGEKLAEGFVRAVLERVLNLHAFAARFMLVAPVDRVPSCYCLYLQPSGAAPDRTVAQRLIDALQAELESNPHYRYAVELGQLTPLELVVLDSAGPAAWTVFEQHRIAQGQKPGNIKPVSLDGGRDWEHVFQPITSGSPPRLVAQRGASFQGGSTPSPHANVHKPACSPPAPATTLSPHQADDAHE